MRRLYTLAPMMLALALAGSACSGDDDSDSGGTNGSSADVNGNVIVNGGFEAGREPWIVLRPPDWQLSTDKAHSGSASAHLEMRDTAVSETDKIYYLVQELAPAELPEVLSGNYFVANWVKGTKSQYLQFVVILWADDVTGMPPCPGGNPCPNYQIRYLLAGIDEDPFQISNAKFFYLTKEQPVQGEWVHFERNLVEDFQTLWGGVPKDLSNIRLLFEVRYDKKTAEEGPLEADVYYDDLYLGPAGAAP